jgi:hypothetical protein
MRRRLFVVATAALSAAVALSAHAARPSISTDVAPGANFAAYKTFAFVNARVPEGMDPVAFQRILTDIETGLNAKGYQRANPADLSLILSLGAQNKTDIQSWGAWGLRTDVWQYTEGKLSVDAFDTKTKQAVWHGLASEDINPGKPNNGAIDHAISKLMEKFPAGGGAGSASAAP